MSTPFSKVYTKFLDKVEKDNDFFNYYNLSKEESMAIAIERSKAFLEESVADLTLKCTPDIDFNDYDEIIGEFKEDLTRNEINLLACLMFEKYVSRDTALLKTFILNFTPSDIQVFSPANERKSFLSMYSKLQLDNNVMIDNYISKDRLTGKKKGIQYSNYEEY
jgi:hypothetical protein